MSKSIRCIGPSHDRRTNAWEVICPACGPALRPLTTLLRHQQVRCDEDIVHDRRKRRKACGTEFTVDYNEEKITSIRSPDNE